MPNYNRIVLVGHLCRDIELKYSPSGMAIGKTSIAVTHKRKESESTCFVDLTLFGKTAELANTYLKKGSATLVEGRLEFDQWEKDGVKRSKHSVAVDNVQFLGGGKGKHDDSGEPEPMGAGEKRKLARQAKDDVEDDSSLPF